METDGGQRSRRRERERTPHFSCSLRGEKRAAAKTPGQNRGPRVSLVGIWGLIPDRGLVGF